MTRTRTWLVAAALVSVVATAGVVAVADRAAAGDAGGGGTAEPVELVNCFTYGIDAVGRGDFDRGQAMWEDCFTEDYSFDFTFFPGGPSLECPGPNCPVQEFESRAELRAKFASTNFEMQGYLATQHQMFDVHEVSRDEDQATVTAYIQANHFLPDDSVDIFWGDYTIEAVNVDGRWKVRREEIVGTSFLNFQGTPIG